MRYEGGAMKSVFLLQHLHIMSEDITQKYKTAILKKSNKVAVFD